MTGALALALAGGDPADRLAGDEPAAIGELAPDPVATHPAGLDPRTLCRAGAPCEPAQASAPAPVVVAIAIGGAQLAYDRHPTRTGGSETSARLALSRGLAWSAHVSYQVDTIAARSPAGASTTAFTDGALGGHLALPFAVPSWFIGAVHLLSGAASGNGNAVYGAIGARLAGAELELGASSMQLDTSTGAGASLRAAHPGHTLGAWLELDAGTAAIGGMSTTHLGACAGIELHRPRWSLDVEGMVGDRALAVTDHGELAEAVTDTFHTSGRAVLRVELGAHLHPYAGVVARTATTAQGIDYALVIGFAGLSFSF